MPNTLGENKQQEEQGRTLNIEESEELEMTEISILKGFEEVELEESRGDSVLTLTSTNLKFNKATAVELGFPAHVRMLVNAATRQAAIQPCKENAKNAVAFSKDKSKQTYAIVLKIPALLTAIRKLADVDENSGAISFNGILYPNERVIIFDLSQGKPAKTRRRRKKAQDDVNSDEIDTRKISE